jgi:hypothetical protein
MIINFQPKDGMMLCGVCGKILRSYDLFQRWEMEAKVVCPCARAQDLGAITIITEG